MAPHSSALELFLRYFWLLGAIAALSNLLLLKSSVESRLATFGYSKRQARLAWAIAQGSLVAVGAAQFTIQSLSGSPNNPLLAFFPGFGPFTNAAFGVLIFWSGSTLVWAWLSREGLIFSSAACQGLVSPRTARLILTAAPMILWPYVLMLMRVAA